MCGSSPNGVHITFGFYVNYNIFILQGRGKDFVTAIWLISCLNSYHFSWPNFELDYCMFTSFQSLIPEPGFCDSGDTWKITAFLQIRGRQRTWGRDPQSLLLSYMYIVSISHFTLQNQHLFDCKYRVILDSILEYTYFLVSCIITLPSLLLHLFS